MRHIFPFIAALAALIQLLHPGAAGAQENSAAVAGQHGILAVYDPDRFNALAARSFFDALANRLARSGLGREARNVLRLKELEVRAYEGRRPEIKAVVARQIESFFTPSDVAAAAADVGGYDVLLAMIEILTAVRLDQADEVARSYYRTLDEIAARGPLTAGETPRRGIPAAAPDLPSYRILWTIPLTAHEILVQKREPPAFDTYPPAESLSPVAADMAFKLHIFTQAAYLSDHHPLSASLTEPMAAIFHLPSSKADTPALQKLRLLPEVALMALSSAVAPLYSRSSIDLYVSLARGDGNYER